MIRKTLLALAVIAASASIASADASLSVNIELDDDATIQTVRYQCENGERLKVQYINSQDDQLALVPTDGDDDERLFVNVVSGSGARYVAGQYEWFTKGDKATLTDTIRKIAPVNCEAVAQ